MLDVTARQWEALGDALVKSETRAQALYQGAVVDLNVVQDDGGITWSANGQIQATGSLHVFGYGDSLVPVARDSMLAPYGQEVSVSRLVRMRGEADLEIPLGVYRITSNDGGRFRSRLGQVADWEVGLDFADRLRMLERAKIIDPASAPSSATVYSELQRLALFPLLQDELEVPDASVPKKTTYDSRLAGVYDLAAMVGAKPRVTREGALTLRPADRWLTETTPDFDITGTISWSAEQTDDFYNLVWAHSDDGRYNGFAQLDDDSDARSVNRAGPSTYEHSSPVYTSWAGAANGARTILRRLLNRRSRVVSVEVGAQGLALELSDFGWIRDPEQEREVLGEISAISISHDPVRPIKLELIVAED